MAEAVASGTSVEVITQEAQEGTVVLRLHKPKSEKAVKWKEGTVDNEHLGRKKSKCCCIYTKPHKFGESDTESDSDDDSDDCCHEHRVARRRIPKQQPSEPPAQGSDS